MRIFNMTVSGDLTLNMKFEEKNVLLGENNTGKSTFVKLILYALGVEINNFIEEITVHNKCNSVSLAIQTKSNNKYLITRKLPYSDMVNVFPVDSNNEVLVQEVLVYNLEEYSDFLLAEELYSQETISYGQGKKASLRYYFLLRGAVVDQTTPHARILSNLSGEKNDYIASQPLINTAIIENVLSRNTTEIQRLRLSLKEKEKERNQINEKITFFSEMISEKLTKHQNLPNTADKINLEIQAVSQEEKNLSAERYDVLMQLEKSADKQIEREIFQLKTTLNKEKEIKNAILLNISDAEAAQTKLKEELEIIKKRLASQKIISNIPVTICPICFSEVAQDSFCEHCKEIDNEKNIEALAVYKKLIEDSLKESIVLLREYKEDLSQCETKIVNYNKQLNELEEKYVIRLRNLRTPLQGMIDELKERIKFLSSRQIILRDLLSYMNENEKNKNQRKKINEELQELRVELDKASQKSMEDMRIAETWIEYYNDIYNEIFGTLDNKIELDDSYMPLINGTEIQKISSESVKLVAQLAYIFTLATLNNKLDKSSINHLGFIIFDSPKDKDLDLDKYKRFLSLLNQVNNVQIFLTGSILDKESYLGAFPEAYYLPELSEQNRLLKETR